MDHLRKAFDENQFHLLSNRCRQMPQVLGIRFGQNNASQPSTTRCQDFFFDAADGQDQARKGDLSGHRRVGPDGSVGQK